MDQFGDYITIELSMLQGNGVSEQFETSSEIMVNTYIGNIEFYLLPASGWTYTLINAIRWKILAGSI